MTIVILFVITLVTGIILHLKKHGMVIEPRPVIKIVHWVAGFLMVGLSCVHASQFMKMLNAMETKFRWFWADTRVVMAFIFLAFITGLIKLLSPVKIPHLGMWHYWFGMIMSVAVIIHLFRGIPSWNRLRKIKTLK